MRILNFGSINIDHVYRVTQISTPGETISSKQYDQFLGGKGCNQSVAIAAAGVPVWHAGKVGEKAQHYLDLMQSWGVNIDHVMIDKLPTGHAIIQVDDAGQNSIIIHGGANQALTISEINNVLSHFEKGDILLIQNEINSITHIIKSAKKKEMKIWFNPAPFDISIKTLPLELVDLLIVNQSEATGLIEWHRKEKEEMDMSNEIEQILVDLKVCYPTKCIILTAGSKGAYYMDKEQRLFVAAEHVKAVDTTGAGDCFIGYLLARTAKGDSIEAAMQFASKAAALTVTKKGGATSIANHSKN